MLSKRLSLVASTILLSVLCVGCDSQALHAALTPDLTAKKIGRNSTTSGLENSKVRLLTGELVTIADAAKPPLITPEDIPQNLNDIIASNQAVTVGHFRNLIPLLAISKSPNLPVPYNGSGSTSVGGISTIATRRRDGSTTGVPDHSARGWAYGSANNSVHPYYGQGFIEFAVDIAAPTLYLNTPGDTINPYVYYAPTVQGTDGNPLEISFTTFFTQANAAGAAELKIYNFASSNGQPCNGAGQQACIGFLPGVVPIDASFFSKYVRNIGQPVAEFSLISFLSGTTWYASIYNHTTSTYDVIASSAHSEVVYDQRYTNGTLGVTGGHAYDEYYLPTRTVCASVDPTNPLSGEPLTSNAQQYSSITKQWIRVSVDSHAYDDSGGLQDCLNAPSPYESFGYYGDGFSNWRAVPN